MLSMTFLLLLVFYWTIKKPASTVNPLSYVKNVPNSIDLEDVSEHEVSDIIKSLSTSSAG